MGRPKPFHTRTVHERREYPKQTARKISGGKDSKKQSDEVEYDICGCCPAGLVVYPESIEDVLDTDCHYAFTENFEMFLRKQRDKNTGTDMQFKLKHEEQMSFASMTAKIGTGARCFDQDCFECKNDEKMGSYFLAMVGNKFTSRPDRSNYNWPDDMLEGFGEADALITHLKDLDKDFGHKNLKDLSVDSVKAVKKDLVVSGYRWVVEQLEAALEEFKEFRDGLDENEREKWDKSVVQQSEKFSDFEMESFESYKEECERFEEVNALIKDLHKEMDDIIARYNNRNKDIDSLVELIEGKSLGAVPKKKREKNISKSRKKNNPEIKRKDGIEHAENEGNVNSQQLEEKLEQMLIATEVDKADVKKMEEESQLINSVEKLVFAESELSEREERSIRVKSNISPKYLILEKHEKYQNVKELKSGIVLKSGERKDAPMNKLDSVQKEAETNHVFSSNVENGENQIDEVQKDNVVNGQILINDVKKDKKSKPNCARASCPNKGRHKCSRCKAVFYCAQDCLNMDWPHHKKFCDYVFKANQLPDDSTSKKSSEIENSGGREEVD